MFTSPYYNTVTEKKGGWIAALLISGKPDF